MENLLIDSIEIRHFRAFRHLRIERLGRVNLVVGKNSVGKSCLLEALNLYANKGSLSVILDLLETRDEIMSISTAIASERALERQILALRHLFYGRRDIIRDSIDPIQIGPVDSPDHTLSIAIGWLEETKTVKVPAGILSPFHPSKLSERFSAENPIPMLIASIGTERILVQSLDEYRRIEIPPNAQILHCRFISAGGLDGEEIGRLWDGTTLTDREEDVLAALKTIPPKVERINLVSDPERARMRYAVVKIAGHDSPISLRSLGEGKNRMFGIALALANSQGGLLLIDEIESGLHYSVQLDLWRFIFQVASHLNVQVVATSHSWDCIEAFQKAAQEFSESQAHTKPQSPATSEGVLIRLESKNGEVNATLFDTRRLSIATREQIEVR